MSPEERDAITTSIANLWTFNALFISHLLRSLRENGMPPEAIEAMLQDMDFAVGEVLDDADDQDRATGLLATVRTMLQGGGD